jgi:hypothetical protein
MLISTICINNLRVNNILYYNYKSKVPTLVHNMTSHTAEMAWPLAHDKSYRQYAKLGDASLQHKRFS